MKAGRNPRKGTQKSPGKQAEIPEKARRNPRESRQKSLGKQAEIIGEAVIMKPEQVIPMTMQAGDAPAGRRLTGLRLCIASGLILLHTAAAQIEVCYEALGSPVTRASYTSGPNAIFTVSAIGSVFPIP